MFDFALSRCLSVSTTPYLCTLGKELMLVRGLLASAQEWDNAAVSGNRAGRRREKKMIEGQGAANCRYGPMLRYST